MRSLLRKITRILDGTPADYGHRSQGQSLVELALVTPILIIMLMGLAEIGWFANNFMILLEVTRTGARFGTVQTGDTSPLLWNEDASLLPYPPFTPAGDPNTALRTNIRSCSAVATESRYQGFYSLLSCVMLQSMDPLRFSYDNDVDDIVISVFSLQLVNPNDLPVGPLRTNAQLSMNFGVPNNLPQVLVVGRYPTNANECTLNALGAGFRWERDPFDFIQDSTRNSIEGTPPTVENRIYFELAGFDPPQTGNPPTWERQRGYALTGQHRIEGTGGNCAGSEWTLDEIQQLINLPGFSLLPDQRPRLASMGMVMVEMFWQHELLLKNPVFNPVFTMLGNRTTLSVWAAFPVPAAEPRIKFN